MSTWVSRLGGANNCLTVTVTKDAVCATVAFPFGLIAAVYGIDRRIPADAIVSVELQSAPIAGPRVVINYRLRDGGQTSYEIRSRRSNELIKAIKAIASI